MKKGLTELVFIIDRSGSMHGMEADTIGGFNSTIEKQKELPGEVYVSTVLFSNSSTVLHDRLDIREVEPMTERDYRTGGCTALLDAIGDAIHHIANVHKYARAEDVPENTIFFITTDGMENASRRYSSEAVKRMIRKEESKYGWQFYFVAANIDAVQTADNIGIRAERAADYKQTSRGTRKVYEAMDMALCSARMKAPMEAEAWKRPLSEDD